MKTLMKPQRTAITHRVIRRVATAVIVIASWAGPARAQIGIGIAYPGVPMPFYTPQYAPSPTDYLYDRDRARVSAYGSMLQQQAAASSMPPASGGSNGSFQRLRDYSGEDTYHVNSRQSLSRRAAPRPPSSRQAAKTPGVLPIDAYFLPSGALDWPRDAPDSPSLHAARVEAENAVTIVRDEIRSTGKAKAQSVGAAKWALVKYGQDGLAEVNSTRSKVVGHLFHYFLLFLNQSLDDAAGTHAS